MTTLKFQTENAKLNKSRVRVAAFSIPAGHACPFAEGCLSKAHRITGKISDGKNATIRCFAATDEAKSPQARNARWHNYDALRACDSTDEMVKLIHNSLPKENVIRVHVSGDFFNQKYFNAWASVAKLNSDKYFYAYTKSIPYWVAYLEESGALPSNFNLTASYGSRYDSLIEKYNLKYALTVWHPDEAKKLGLEIDHDDSHALGLTPFALLLHGTQPAGSPASAALSKMRKQGIKFSYSK